MKKLHALVFVFTFPIIFINTAVNAALATDAFLNFDSGIPDPSDATMPPISGSYFGMRLAPTTTVYTTLDQLDLIKLGVIQPASGSHTGEPSGTENPGIDLPWAFFGNTGMHQTIAPLTIVSDDGAGNVTLDFTGWGLTWNGIPNVPLGGSSSFYEDTGIATMTCVSTCESGDSYVLTYSAHLPPGDPSTFGGVQYTVHLEGVISTPATNVTIDIKPRKKSGDVISFKKDRNLKVAIVGDSDFDALQVDPATVRFGPSEASPVRFKGKDYNRDGFSDLILTFKLKDTGIDCASDSATLTGQTFHDPGINITGSSSFTVKACP